MVHNLALLMSAKFEKKTQKTGSVIIQNGMVFNHNGNIEL